MTPPSAAARSPDSLPEFPAPSVSPSSGSLESASLTGPPRVCLPGMLWLRVTHYSASGCPSAQGLDAEEVPTWFPRVSKCVLIKGSLAGNHVSDLTGGSMENTSLTARKAWMSIADGFPILGLQRWLNGEEIANLFLYNFLVVLFQCRSKASQHEVVVCLTWAAREGRGMGCPVGVNSVNPGLRGYRPQGSLVGGRLPGDPVLPPHLVTRDEKEGEQGCPGSQGRTCRLARGPHRQYWGPLQRCGPVQVPRGALLFGDSGATICGGFPLCRTSSVVDTGQALLHGEAGGDGIGLESPHCLPVAGDRAPQSLLNTPPPTAHMAGQGGGGAATRLRV